MVIRLDENYNAMTSTALLGYVGETNARPVSVEGLTVDGADRYVLTIDYGDGVAYEVDITGGTWTPTADILRSAQTVSCQICAKKLSGDEYILVKKSRIFRLRIGAAIGDNAVPSPDVAMDALDRIDAIGRQVRADMQTAVTAAETATTSAENAKKSATAAEKSADTATQAASRAETAKTSAETSATQADTARQGAENARAEAVTAQNAAKISAAQASVSAQQTEADKTITSGYAKTAKTCADSTAADRQAVTDMATQVTADKATVADNAAQVATDKASVAADKADIVSMKLEISNTATKLDTEYNNLTSNYYTKELANSTFTTKTEINNTNNNVSQLKEDIDDLLTNVKSKNLLDKTKVTTSPYNYINPNGNTETYGNNFVTDYIPVESGKVVTLSRYLVSSGKFIQSSYVSICMFDADKNVKSGGDYNKTTCTIPNGVAFVRITLNKSYFLDVDSMVELTDDGAPTIYEPYSSASKKLTDEIIESSKIATIEYVDSKKYTMSLLTDNIGCSLPKSEYFMTVGIEESWYTDSFATPKGFFVNMYSGSQADRHDGKYTFSNISSYYGNNAYLWNLYDMLLNLVKNEANTGTGYARNCKSLNLQDCSLLCIGDSTVDHDVMTAKIKSFFTENGKTVTLLGTLGDGKGTGNNNEGRAGWTTSDYFTNKTYDGVVNPFYNPSSQTFDFAYYMRNHNYSSVDFVAIQLGINDLYNFDDTKIIPTWENIKAMIDSIHAFNPSVKVILNLPTTPNADQSKHSVFEPLYRNRVVRYCDYATTKAKELYPTTRVRVSYNHLILNPDTDIRDNVHPTNGGYEKMGLEVCNQINCWQNS
ncbi:GDSL-type esterase/lipase family protein [Ruminococcus bicirculans (ex Wegman et al. 2014)]|uniref:GDSL-type esterase/lipase family protein n=1 Tax=Ruminococcus bicirculans (ex Wegman et al. 2014) TaxID=1160721 RepID=UPI003A8E9E80